jgi:hypothetical protein
VGNEWKRLLLLSSRPTMKKEKCHLTAKAHSRTEALSVDFLRSLRSLSLAHRGTSVSFLLILHLLQNRTGLPINMRGAWDV